MNDNNTSNNLDSNNETTEWYNNSDTVSDNNSSANSTSNNTSSTYNTNYNYGTDIPDSYDYTNGLPMEATIPIDECVVSTKDWLITFLLQTIPIVGLVLLIKWSFGKGNINRKCYSRAALLNILLVTLSTIILIVFIIWAIRSAFAWFLHAFQ